MWCHWNRTLMSSLQHFIAHIILHPEKFVSYLCVLFNFCSQFVINLTCGHTVATPWAIIPEVMFHCISLYEHDQWTYTCQQDKHCWALSTLSHAHIFGYDCLCRNLNVAVPHSKGVVHSFSAFAIVNFSILFWKGLALPVSPVHDHTCITRLRVPHPVNMNRSIELKLNQSISTNSSCIPLW